MDDLEDDFAHVLEMRRLYLNIVKARNKQLGSDITGRKLADSVTVGMVVYAQSQYMNELQKFCVKHDATVDTREAIVTIKGCIVRSLRQ